MSSLHGNCNFRNLEFNTVCGCQEFTPEEDEDVSVGTTGLLSTGGRARKTCLCGHFINFHSKCIDRPREHAPKRHIISDSFRSARLRSGATTPTSIALTSNKQPTPATEPGQDYGDTYTLSKTFEDPPARYQQNPNNRILAGSFSDAAGLGISLRTTRDTDRSYAGRSGDSSAVTEIAPHVANVHGRTVQQPPLLSDTRRGQRGGTLLRSARSSPLLGHQQMQQLNLNSTYKVTAADDTTPVASTVADEQVITGQERYLEFDRRVNGALHIVRGLSQAFLPLSLQEGIRLHTPTARRDSAPFIAFDERDANDELRRQTLAIEAQLRTLARTVAGRLNDGAADEEPRNRIEELPQSVPSEGPARLQALKSSPLKPPVDEVRTAVEDESSSSPQASPPPPAEDGDEVVLTSSALMPPPAGVVSESFVNKKIHDIVEKVDLQEEICNDVMKFKNDKEEEIEELGANVFGLEERLSNMENQFHRFLEDREQSFRKRSREDEDDDGERKKRSKRHRREATTADLRTPSLLDKPDKSHKKTARGSELLDGTFKQTLTTMTSFTRTHSTATSFTSASSSSTSVPVNQAALIKSLTSKIGFLQQRLQQIEAVAIPSCERPWTVQVVALPQSIWATWRGTKDGDLLEQQKVPRALQSSSRAWKRLHSRGLIKCLEVTGGEARDVERAIRKAFGGVFSALYDAGDASTKEDGPYEWSPLRKAPEQITLRALSNDEMSRQFWKVDFLRGTCAEDLRSSTPNPSRSSPHHLYDPSKGSQVARAGASPTKSQSSGPKPTHRLYITNCRTDAMCGSWDLTRDNTQLSSAHSKRHTGSAFSTQPSSLGAQTLRRRLGVDGGSGSPKMGADQSYRSGWSAIRNLRPETVYIYDNKHQIASMKPRPAEDEAFWYYDPSLDGPRDDGSSSSSSSSSGYGSASVTDVQVAVPTVAVTANDDELMRSRRSPSYSRRHEAQQSQKLGTQQSCTLQETAAASSIPQQQPLLVSQASFSGRQEPSLLRNSVKNTGDGEFASASPGLLSYDSDSTPKASFLATPGSFVNSAAVAAAKPLRRSRRNRDAKAASQMTANSLLDLHRGGTSQTLSRQDSKGSGAERWEDAPLRLSRASTAEREA
ncbi:hypothetical protein Dda_4737 [Drechslerella dactyloides]|uniref:Uncharacterized protein n=1 Tax=Drechslerella dactyloides TaxID=74499 RepID=A0AAD6IXX0_DREDA|nr:hypothetical protein Dda_4737 [Drechslerella dactyloides]